MNETMIEITALQVPDNQRLNALPKAFGLLQGLKFESTVYSFARTFCPLYTGGYWEYFTTSNGGFFMQPDEAYLFESENGFCKMLEPNTLGIVLAMYVLSHLSFSAKDDRFASAYHALREYVHHHADAATIFAACD